LSHAVKQCHVIVHLMDISTPDIDIYIYYNFVIPAFNTLLSDSIVGKYICYSFVYTVNFRVFKENLTLY